VGGVNCCQCGGRIASDPGRHYCTAADNRTGLHIGDHVHVDGVHGQIISLRTNGTTGSAEVYFRPTFSARWYSTNQLGVTS
jgi:hypothetical protein